MDDLTMDDLYDIYEDAGLSHEEIMEAIDGYYGIDALDTPAPPDPEEENHATEILDSPTSG
jgi:hypothetical protein